MTNQEYAPLVFYVNGRKIVENHADPSMSLLSYLREKLRLCGTKRGCNEGACGSCTVMVSKFDQQKGKIRHYSINACLASIATMHGLAVTTVEGIGSTKTKLHPVQERLAKAHGSQCGFCTPGFVMSMYTLLRNNPEPTMEEIELNLLGNLCRCTGYRPILEGFRTFTKQNYGCGKENCCKRKSNIENGESANHIRDLEHTPVLFDPKIFAPYDPSQDLIFPPDLQMESKELQSQSLLITGDNILFHKVASLTELLQLKHDYPEAKIIGGNTIKAIVKNMESEKPRRILYSADIPDLKNIEINDSYVEFGSALTISDVEEEVKIIVKQGPESKIQNFRSMSEMLPWFADRQIKNVGSIGGNVMNELSISDFNCIFMASEATLIFRSKDNVRKIKADGEFFQNKQNLVKDDEVLVAIRIPFIKENEFFKSLKQSKRRGKDLSIVNTAMKVTLEFPSLKISSMIMAVGGVSKTTIMADKTMAKVVGQTWDETFLNSGISLLIEETKAKLSSDESTEYKTALVAGFFFRFYLFVCEEIYKKFPKLGSPLKLDEADVILPFRTPCTKSMQFFQDVPEDQEKIDPVGRPVPHVSALKQTTGEATYVDDIPSFENELHAALVLSEKAHAKILNIDPSEALKMEGVEGFFSAKDLSESQNQTGFDIFDEEVFASSEVHFVGQIIGIVVAENEKLARLAAKKITIKYEEYSKIILSIEEAIEEKTVWDPLLIEKGNIEKGFENSKHILEGESRLGGQEHLYLETNGHIAIPSEDGEIEVIGAMQAPSTMQKLIAKLLEIDYNRVTCKTKRIGGAFGGKTSRSIPCALPVALAAVKTQRPVRSILTRSEDMMITGGRQPTLAKWKIGFGDDGQLHAFDAKYYLNCGNALDLSGAVLEKLVFHADNVYKIENLKIWGQCCKTNLAPNTSFRALAMPQVVFVMENIISQVADYLHMSPVEIREKNMYPKTKYATPFGQELTKITVRDCFDQVISSSNFEERKRAIDIFNRNNRYKKRGIAVTPFKYPIGFCLPFLSQGAALVHVYLDGSVLVSHGGVEYGQGLNTKMLQVASRALKIPISRIYIAETNTDKVPNTSTTAASAASDLCGMAVLNACSRISTRLAPYRNKSPECTWEEAVSAAYMDRVPLSATGFYIIPGVTEYSFKERKPASPYSYYSYGASVSEVEINCLTGEHSVLRADIVMDVGKSINPAIDIGQIEGAFAQGYGLVTLEKLVYSSSGELLTKGPNAYKLPCVMNIPREFYVTLLRDSGEERAVYSSKATGESSVLAGSSTFMAVREAIKAARNEDQLSIPFHSPATSERIRMACPDWITSKISSII